MCSTARSSLNANPAIVIRSSSPSCVTSSQCAGPTRHPSRRRQPRHPQASQGQSVARPPSALAHSLHPPLTPLGSTKSNVSSPSSPNTPSVMALSIPPPTSSKKSIASSALTTQIHTPSCGLPQLTPSFRTSHDFVSELPGQGQNTSCPYRFSERSHLGLVCGFPEPRRSASIAAQGIH